MMEVSDINWVASSDVAIVETIGAFIKHHRLLQNKTQQQVATDAGVNRSTIVQLENGESITLLTLIQVLRVLNLLYVIDVFRIKEQLSPLQLAKQEQGKRKRASSKGNNDQTPSDW
ncbi:helix-turn-helix domain-containing protein [Flavobacterium caeni]|uniref:Transcriptional regulator, XRE family n=1 Tax=Flavobacterium caeni TaxID=490189 RepID=A0A1G5K6L6_9FLAO|nr:helix-turn-helix transcriptional regulator [Flavobacterium caeni]SCY96263.1 transcriptional regulator, XRE family [Flavobacterium caeni]